VQIRNGRNVIKKKKKKKKKKVCSDTEETENRNVQGFGCSLGGTLVERSHGTRERSGTSEKSKKWRETVV